MKKRTMKACAMFLTLLFLMLVPVTAYADTAYVVTGTTNYLALRTEPRTDSRNEIGKLHNGDTVGTLKTVTGTKNYLALRKAAVRSDSNEIGRLYNGNPFYVLRWENNGFAYGYTAAGQYGYVVSAYLK